MQLKSDRYLIISFLFFCLFAATPLFSQTENEEILLETQSNESASELLEKLQSLRLNPIDLNRATYRKIKQIPFITPYQIRVIIRERSRNGPFVSWIDFNNRLHFDKQLAILIRPYVILSPKVKKKNPLLIHRTRVQKRLIESSGFTSGAFTGSPLKIHQRLTIAPSRQLQIGFLAEKDPGEQTWNDHFVGYIETSRPGILDRWVLGCYRIEVGQGLVMWGPYGFFKGSNPGSIIEKQGKGIDGYAYSDENAYLKGAAIETHWQSFQLLLFASQNKMDATSNDDGTIRSLSVSGLHRTDNEIEHKDQVMEKLGGARIIKNYPWGTVSLSGWWNYYSRTLNKKDSLRYFYSFQGNKNSVLGIDCNIFIKRIHLTAEIARSLSGGIAWIGNTSIDLNTGTLVFSMRYFHPEFHNPHGNCFGTDHISNQYGIYFGFKGRLTTSTGFSTFFDLYKRPWRTYFIPVPTSQSDFFVEFEQKCSRNIRILFRARIRDSQQIEKSVSPSGAEIDFLGNQTHYCGRVECRFKYKSKMKFKSRLEAVKIHFPHRLGKDQVGSHTETGTLFYLDFWWRPFKSFIITTRYALFKTDSYNSRIYVMENDTPGLLTIPPLYGKGSRLYILLRWQVLSLVRLSVKFASTRRHGVTEIGSGYNQITGDKDQHINIQVDFKL